MSAKVIVVSSEKGGVGKTFLSVNISFGLAKHGKTLLIDFDPQSSSSKRYAGLLDYVELTGSETVFDKKHPTLSYSQAVIGSSRTPVPNLYISVTNYRFVEALSEAGTHARSAMFLSRALKNNKDDFDYIIVDCPPDLSSIATVNGLTAADVLLCPVNTDFDSFSGVSKTLAKLDECVDDRPEIQLIVNAFDPREIDSLRDALPYLSDYSERGYYSGLSVPRTASAKKAHGTKMLPVELFRPSETRPTTEGISKVIEFVK